MGHRLVRERQGDRDGIQRGTSSEDGLTLVELVIAILLLGIIFAGVAGFLINSATALQINERRIASTALLTQAQEEMQGIPWFDLALYEGELDDLTSLDQVSAELIDLGLDIPGGTFEGREIVVIPGPDNSGCPSGSETCGRRSAVPQPTEIGSSSVDGREFQIARLITWVERDAADPDDIAPELTKRLTTIAAWEVRPGQWTLERFDSERAATTAELGDPTENRILIYDLSPSLRSLTDPGQRSDGDANALLRLSRQLSGLVTVEYRFYSLSEAWFEAHIEFTNFDFENYDPDTDDDPPPDPGDPVMVERTITRSDVSFSDQQFETSLELSDYRFPEGTRPIRVRLLNQVSGDVIATSSGEMGFIPNENSIPPVPDPDGTGGGEVPPGDPEAPDVAVREPIIVSPSTVCVNADNRLIEPASVTVYVEGMREEDYSVVMSYIANERNRSETIQPTVDPSAISPTLQEFKRTFAAGGDYGFRPTETVPEVTTFTIVASNSQPSTDSKTSQASLTVTRCG